MQPELEAALLAAAHAGATRRPLAGAEVHVPVERYTDPVRFERERAVVFRAAPNLVAHASELPQPGSFVTRDVVGTPVIVARGDDGVVRALVNVCRHRGATVEARPAGACKRFVCPYHAWSYAPDGALVHVRHAEGFPTLDVADSGLARLPCFEAGGLVWVVPDIGSPVTALDAPTTQVLADIEGLLGGELAVFAAEERVWQANWKLVVDGSLESYHFKIAHRRTIGPAFADTASTHAFVGEHVRLVLPRASAEGIDDIAPDERRLVRHANVLYVMAPNVSVLVQDGHCVLVVMTPEAVDRTRIRLVTVGRAPGPEGHSDGTRRFLAANHAITVAALDEDFGLAEQIQRGITTGVNRSFRFGRFEAALGEWHARLDARLDPGIDTGLDARAHHPGR